MSTLVFLSVGIGSGVLGSLLGIGGGIVMIPFLTLGLGLSMREAMGLSLLSYLGGSMAVSSVKLKDALVNLPIAGVIEFLALIFAIIGARLAFWIDQEFLKRLFALIAIIIAFLMIHNVRKEKKNSVNLILVDTTSSEPLERGSDWFWDSAVREKKYYQPKRLPWVYGLCGLTGLISGLTGIGGGVIMVPAMNLLGKMPMKVSTATGSYVLGVTAMGGGLVFLTKQNLNVEYLAMIILGVYLGTVLSAKYLSRIGSTSLKYLFSGVLMITGLKMLLS